MRLANDGYECRESFRSAFTEPTLLFENLLENVMTHRVQPLGLRDATVGPNQLLAFNAKRRQ